ncbi:hypothetical protein [Haloterrigena alkaliphila]|uniref:Uncharacterized protein n=1 Tax=Haloterrigena alkaliphila TaxID=2816475 RepID=A0A8A2VFL9_9EURY|nr:hypothetical protein [Haloterrigena alkaliphila]QSW99152.1 hypothetical protein J0X25_17510 [Haloterrigena alkaliphila]
MTDRAINFREIVEGIRSSADSDREAAAVVTVSGRDPIDVCQRLFRGLESHPDRSACEFYLSPNARRGIERGLVGSGTTPQSVDFLDRQIRTDVSMPDDAILFMRPDAVTLGGTPTGDSPVGLGTISND